MPGTFIAVQCVRCSTMQVKQQNSRGGNGTKWTCVVCNQKQSCRKVFAQGHMAKDLRKFVQSFNMSRRDREVEEHHLAETLISNSPVKIQVQSKRRAKQFEDDQMANMEEQDAEEGRTGTSNSESTTPDVTASSWWFDHIDKKKKKKSDIAKSSDRLTTVRMDYRWNDCTYGDGNGSMIEGTRNSTNRMTLSNDVKVEDIVHPDFL